MAKKLFIAEEKWNTRFGKSARVVVRDQLGHFVDNKSKRQIKNGEQLDYLVTRFCHTYVIGYMVSAYKRIIMIDTKDELLNELAYHFVDLHNVGGIELEQWDTAYQFVKHFYNTEEMVQIVIGSKK